MKRFNVLRWLMALLVMFAMAGCASCGGEDNNGGSNNGATNGAEPDMTDMGGDDVGGGDDLGSDDMATTDMATEDMPVDMAPSDSDGDGVNDDVDNCPDEPNEDQADRDRDGLGDLCDRLPFIHDPSNPQTVMTVIEDETVINNDNSNLALAYGLELPFVAQGVVGAVENTQPDLDFYTFEVTEPTALLVNIVANQSLWGGLVLLGTEWRNANEWRVHIAPQAGVTQERELFLAYPGQYTIAVSDARNFLAAQPDVGGPGFDYRVSVSALPLPEATALSLPVMGQQTTTDRELKVYDLDTAGVEGLTGVLRGIGADQNSFISPLLIYYDEADQRTLGMNSLGQVGQDYRAVLTSKFSGRDTIKVIQDFSQAFGMSSTALNLEEVNLAAEMETAQMPADGRTQQVPWLAPGETMSAQIDNPRAGASGQVGDEDPYLFAVKRGEVVRITVKPLPNSDLEPFVQFGSLVEQQGESYFVPVHEAPDGAVGAEATVEYLVSALEDGEVAAMVMHAPNYFSSTPVGGSRYGYDITIETLAPSPQPISTVPGSASFMVPDGGYGLVEFPAMANELYTVREESTLIPDLRVLDSTTFEVIGAGRSSVTVATEKDANYLVSFSDLIGRGTGTETATIFVDELTTNALGQLPAVATGVLDTNPTHLYSFTAQQGQAIDIRVATTSFFPAITLFDSLLRPIGTTSYQRREVIIEADGDYVIGVSSSGGSTNPAYSYTLGVEEILPTMLPLGGAPVSGTLDVEPFADWYEIPVTAGQSYAVTSSGSGWTARNAVFDPSDLSLIRTSANGTTRWISEKTGTVWIAMYESSNLGDPTYSYQLAASAITPIPAQLGSTARYELTNAGEEDYFSFMATPGMIEVTVEPVGDWRPRIQLVELDTMNALSEARQTFDTVRYAQSKAGVNLAVTVRQSEPTLTAGLGYDLTVRIVTPAGAINEIEPNNVSAEAMPVVAFPSVYAGANDVSDPIDLYLAQLVRWQRIWALSTDRNNTGGDRYDAQLEIRNESATLVAANSYGGEDFLPAIHGYQVDATGGYEVDFGARTNASITGDYYLYIAATPVTEVTEVEPNDDMSSAQPLALETLTRVAATVDATDAVDVFAVSLGRESRLRVALDGAGNGHALRLLDANGMLVVESGATTLDMAPQPLLDQPQLPMGSYFVEVLQGNAAGGAIDVILLAE